MNANISANTLFHFTTSAKNLLNILARGIYVRYCLENYENLIGDDAELVIPMACFCDIPLSQVKRHKETYGPYAIGLTKSWGMKHKINPVIYTYPNSSTADILNYVARNLNSFFQIDEDELPDSMRQVPKTDEPAPLSDDVILKIYGLSEKLGHFLRYIKPYEGKFYREDGYLRKNVRFYEEREWRFVPTTSFFYEAGIKDSYKPEYYKNPVKRRAINIKLAKYLKLDFSPEDVRFIIVDKEEEIPRFLKEMEEIYADTVPTNSLKLLGTRLISFEQIIHDL